MMTSNEVLTALALLERAVPFLKIGTRESVSKVALQRVQDGVERCIEKLSGNVSKTEILSPLLETTTLVETLLSDSTFIETDAEVKDVMIKALMPAVDALYLEVGKYYIENEFEFKPGLEHILRRVVDKCIEQGFYFGYDKN